MSQTSVLRRPAGVGHAASTLLCGSRTGAFGVAWDHVAGELDPASPPKLEEASAEAQPAASVVVLDLTDTVAGAVAVQPDEMKRCRTKG